MNPTPRTELLQSSALSSRASHTNTTGSALDIPSQIYGYSLGGPRNGYSEWCLSTGILNLRKDSESNDPGREQGNELGKVQTPTQTHYGASSCCRSVGVIPLKCSESQCGSHPLMFSSPGGKNLVSSTSIPISIFQKTCFVFL